MVLVEEAGELPWVGSANGQRRAGERRFADGDGLADAGQVRAAVGGHDEQQVARLGDGFGRILDLDAEIFAALPSELLYPRPAQMKIFGAAGEGGDDAAARDVVGVS